MTNEERIRFIKAKVKNIIYYRLEVEPKIDTRYRCQYMPVLRLLRKQAAGIINDLPKNHPDYNYISGVVSLINPKVMPNECLQTIVNLKKHVEKYGY